MERQVQGGGYTNETRGPDSIEAGGRRLWLTTHTDCPRTPRTAAQDCRHAAPTQHCTAQAARRRDAGALKRRIDSRRT